MTLLSVSQPAGKSTWTDSFSSSKVSLDRVERLVHTSGNRVLRTEEAGDPNGQPVLMLHGTPGAGLFYGPHVTDALGKGIRLIAYDRPGYGGSTSRPGRSV